MLENLVNAQDEKSQYQMKSLMHILKKDYEI